MPNESRPAPAPPSEAVRSAASLAASCLAGLQQAIRGQQNAATLFARGQHAEAKELFATVSDSFVAVAQGLAAIRDNSNKLADLLEKLESQKASPPAAKPAAQRKPIISAETRKFIYDAATRIVAAEVKELGRRVKHADADRGKFNSWCRTYFQDGGKLCAYAERVAEPIVGDAARSVARAVCRDAMEQFVRAADPVEQLEHWESAGVEWTANPFFDALYLAAKAKEEADQLAACT